MKPIIMLKLQAALDQESYEFMASNYPDVLKALESEIAAGHEPREIRTFVIRQTGRPEIAARCEQAARHVLNEQR